MCQKYQQISASISVQKKKNLPSFFVPRTAEKTYCTDSIQCCRTPRKLCRKKYRMLPRKMCLIFTSKTVQKSIVCTVRTDLDFCAVRPRNSCRVRTVINAVLLLVFCALLDLDFYALQTLLYGCLENRALLPFFSLSSLSFSWKWKVKSFASLNPFWLNPKWVSNPTVEKDPIQWLRFNESKNHIYLNHLNKFTHPLKFIKKWL